MGFGRGKIEEISEVILKYLCVKYCIARLYFRAGLNRVEHNVKPNG